MVRLLLILSVLIAADKNDGDIEKARPLEGLAKAGVGAVLSSILETPCSVGGVQLNLRQQFLELSDLKIANPKKFSEGDAIAVKKVRVEADPKVLFSDEPAIRLIQVSGATVNAEQSLSQGLNLKKLLDNAKGSGKDSKSHKGGSKKKWRIEKAVLDDATANITTEMPLRKTAQKKIGYLEMTFGGKDNQGVPADEAMTQVLQTLIDKLGLFQDGGVAPLVNLLGR